MDGLVCVCVRERERVSSSSPSFAAVSAASFPPAAAAAAFSLASSALSASLAETFANADIADALAASACACTACSCDFSTFIAESCAFAAPCKMDPKSVLTHGEIRVQFGVQKQRTDRQCLGLLSARGVYCCLRRRQLLPK